MIRRNLLAVAVAAMTVLPLAPAAAQEADCGSFADLCDGIEQITTELEPVADGVEPVYEGLEPVTSELVPVLEDAIAQIREGLEGGLENLAPVCEGLAPVLDEIDPVIDDAQALLDTVTGEAGEIVDPLAPLLDELNALIDVVLDACEVEEVPVEQTEQLTPAAEQEPAPVVEQDVSLPRTGGGIAGLGMGLLGLSGLGAALRRRS